MAATLTGETVAILRAWLKERQGEPADPLFPTRQGRPLSRYTVGVIVAKHAATAATSFPSLTAKRVTPHTYADLLVMPICPTVALRDMDFAMMRSA
jgi:hypothetical protein